MNDKIIHHDKTCTEQSAANDVAQPVHAGKQPADEHETGEDKTDKSKNLLDRCAFYAGTQLHDSG